MLNKVMLIGNLGADPEVRYMPSGETTVTLSLATTRRWKDRQSNEQKEHTEWHRVVFFGKLAEIAGQYLKKGSQAYIEGRIQTNKWKDKTTGQDRYSTEIIAEELRMLGSKTGGTGDFGNTSQGVYAEPEYQQPAQQPFNQQMPPPPMQPFAPAQPQYAQQPPIQQPQTQYAPPPVQQPFNPAPPPQFNQQPAQQPYNQQVPPPPQFRQPPAAPAFDDFDDDVPF